MVKPNEVASHIIRKIYWRVRKSAIVREVYGRVRNWEFRNSLSPQKAKRREEYLSADATYTEDSLIVGGSEVMQEWERPLMRALAAEVTRSKGHVLEVGFGMGISANYLVELGCSKYTVIEPHPVVLKKARAWAKAQPVPVQVVEGFWQDVIDRLDLFDGILFDTYVASAEDTGTRLYVPFIPKAAGHLKPGGVFTFFSAAADTFDADHLQLLLQYFQEVRVFKVSGLRPPSSCQYWSTTTMVVPVCTK